MTATSDRRPTTPRQPHPLTRRGLLATGVNAAGGAMFRSGRPAAVRAQASDIESALTAMSPAERIGQLFVLPVTGTVLGSADAAMLRELQPGGVILVEENIGTADVLLTLIADIHATNLARPPLIAVDQEGGLVTRLFSDPVPGPEVLATLPTAEITALATERGTFLDGFGFSVNYAPVADVAFSPDSFMAGRSFGGDPVLVAEQVAAVVTGTNATPVRATAKHFPGHGRTTVDSHLALPTVEIDDDTWWATDALPFRAAVAAGVPQIMLGHLSYPGWDTLPASLSPAAVAVLREGLGFTGAVISDDLGMDALAAYDPLAVVELAITAGLDSLLYVTTSLPYPDLVAHLQDLVAAGTIPSARIDESVRRLLALRVAAMPASLGYSAVWTLCRRA